MKDRLSIHGWPFFFVYTRGDRVAQNKQPPVEIFPGDCMPGHKRPHSRGYETPGYKQAAPSGADLPFLIFLCIKKSVQQNVLLFFQHVYFAFKKGNGSRKSAPSGAVVF
jgi:hypothetical protein